jgi:hypothetical protein
MALDAAAAASTGSTTGTKGLFVSWVNLGGVYLRPDLKAK